MRKPSCLFLMWLNRLKALASSWTSTAEKGSNSGERPWPREVGSENCKDTSGTRDLGTRVLERGGRESKKNSKVQGFQRRPKNGGPLGAI